MTPRPRKGTRRKPAGSRTRSQAKLLDSILPVRARDAKLQKARELVVRAAMRWEAARGWAHGNKGTQRPCSGCNLARAVAALRKAEGKS